MAELIMFVDIDFGGLHTHIFGSTADFTKLSLGGTGSGIDGNWNDKLSSFKIVSGRWQFFKDIDFGPTPLPNEQGFGPGLYQWVEDYGIDNDSISSVQLIDK